MQAAELLCISRTTLRAKLRAHGFVVEKWLCLTSIIIPATARFQGRYAIDRCQFGRCGSSGEPATSMTFCPRPSNTVTRPCPSPVAPMVTNRWFLPLNVETKPRPSASAITGTDFWAPADAFLDSGPRLNSGLSAPTEVIETKATPSAHAKVLQRRLLPSSIAKRSSTLCIFKSPCLKSPLDPVRATGGGGYRNDLRNQRARLGGKRHCHYKP